MNLRCYLGIHKWEYKIEEGGEWGKSYIASALQGESPVKIRICKFCFKKMGKYFFSDSYNMPLALNRMELRNKKIKELLEK